MSYTEQDVERAAPRVWAEDYFFCHGTYPDEADPPLRWEDIPEAFRVHARALSRAVLEAIEREPLEDVLTAVKHDLHLEREPNSDYPEWHVWLDEQHEGTGATIDEAIRNAVKAAKGDE